MTATVRRAVHVQRTYPVTGSVADVVDYLADFAHTEEWDPGTIRCTREDAGPVQVGARWTNVSRFLGRETTLLYRMTEHSASRVTFHGENRTAHSIDDLVVRDADGGTQITYTADVTFKGLARLGDPLMQLVFLRLAATTTAQMTRVLAERFG